MRSEQRIQNDYNSCPVGPFMGPYDQHKSLNLSSQLETSDLDFARYTEFIHPEHVQCKRFAIKDTYDEYPDLHKIDAI